METVIEKPLTKTQRDALLSLMASAPVTKQFLADQRKERESRRHGILEALPRTIAKAEDSAEAAAQNYVQLLEQYRAHEEAMSRLRPILNMACQSSAHLCSLVDAERMRADVQLARLADPRIAQVLLYVDGVIESLPHVYRSSIEYSRNWYGAKVATTRSNAEQVDDARSLLRQMVRDLQGLQVSSYDVDVLPSRLTQMLDKAEGLAKSVDATPLLKRPNLSELGD